MPAAYGNGQDGAALRQPIIRVAPPRRTAKVAFRLRKSGFSVTVPPTDTAHPDAHDDRSDDHKDLEHNLDVHLPPPLTESPDRYVPE